MLSSAIQQIEGTALPTRHMMQDGQIDAEDMGRCRTISLYSYHWYARKIPDSAKSRNIFQVLRVATFLSPIENLAHAYLLATVEL